MKRKEKKSRREIEAERLAEEKRREQEAKDKVLSLLSDCNSTARKTRNIKAATLSKDGCTVFLEVEGMRPVNQMKITWDLDTADGRALRGELHNTIHALQKDPGFPKK